MVEEPAELSPEAKKRRKQRNVAIALALAFFIAIVFFVTILRISGNLGAAS